METRKVRESTAALAKDKKVASSTNSHPTNTKSTAISNKPRSATSSSIDKTSSTPSEKPVQKYLKPTRASHIEPPILKSQSFWHPKKTGPHDATASSKTSDRRRSFERAPSATRLQKAFLSPGPRERTITVRSSSSPSSKLIVEKTSKIARDGKTQALSSRTKSNVKSSNPTINKKTRPVGSKVAKSAENVTQALDSEAKSELDHQEISLEKSVQVEGEGEHNEVGLPRLGLKSDQHSCNTIDEHEQHDDVVDSDQPKNVGGEVEGVIPTVPEELKQSLSIVIEDEEDHVHKPKIQTVESENAGGVELSNEDSKEEKHSPKVSDEIKVGIVEEEGEESNVVIVVENVVKTLDDTEEKYSPNANDEIKVGIIEEEGEESNVVKVVENVVKTLDDTEEKHSPNASDEIKVGIILEEGEESNVVKVVENVVKTFDGTEEKHSPNASDEIKVGIILEEGEESNVVKMVENVVKALDDTEEKHSPNASDEIKVGIILEEGEESNVVHVENVVKTLDDTEGTESESEIGSTQKEGRGNVEGGAEEKTETAATKSQGGSEGKEESPDVIEENKNKLMEKRTNRVKALVGAFETVINYESESASK